MIKQGESLFIPFLNGTGVRDAHQKARTYKSIDACRKALKRDFDKVDIVEYAPVRHGEWIITESPYAEYEEGVDGESHDRWTCSLCGGEAGFDCDPDGFASFQYKTPFCGYCGALMD